MTRTRVAALLVVVLVGACGACGSGRSKARTTTTKPGETRLLFMLPTSLPSGFSIRSGDLEPPRQVPESYAVAIGVPTAGGAFDRVILADVGAATADRTVSPDEHNTIVDVGGANARLRDDPVRGTSLDWFAGHVFASVSAGPGQSEPALALARALRLPVGGASTTTVGVLPAGFSLIDESRIPPGAGQTSELINIAGPSVVAIHVVVTQVPLIFVVGGGDHVQPETVRDHAALASTRTRIAAGGTQVTESALGWFERPGVAVSIVASTTIDRLQPIADGLRTVTGTEWLKAVPVPTTTTAP